MRRILISLAFIAAPVAAQVTIPPAAPTAQAPVAPTAPSASTAVWDPAAGYITVGQDEPGYRSWYLAAPWRAAQVKSFNDYLATLRSPALCRPGSCCAPRRRGRTAADSRSRFRRRPNGRTWSRRLRYVRDYVIPQVGPVEPVSVYRNPALNLCAGGAPESAHKHDSAIDMVPLRPITREVLMRTLCTNHSEHGAAYNAGLGFYAYSAIPRR